MLGSFAAGCKSSKERWCIEGRRKKKLEDLIESWEEP